MQRSCMVAKNGIFRNFQEYKIKVDRSSSTQKRFKTMPLNKIEITPKLYAFWPISKSTKIGLSSLEGKVLGLIFHY